VLIRRSLLREEDQADFCDTITSPLRDSLLCFFLDFLPHRQELNEKEKKPELNLARRAVIAANKDTVAVRTTQDVESCRRLVAAQRNSREGGRLTLGSLPCSSIPKAGRYSVPPVSWMFDVLPSPQSRILKASGVNVPLASSMCDISRPHNHDPEGQWIQCATDQLDV